MSHFSQIVPPDAAVTDHLTGFCRGTRVLTPFGLAPIESLQIGMSIMARDGSTAQITATHSLIASRDVATRMVRIAADACGYASPDRALILPSDQLVVVSGDHLAEYFGLDEALAPAGALVNGKGLRLTMPAAGEIWHSITCDRPAVLAVEGLQLGFGRAEGLTVLTEAEARLLALAA